MGAHLWEELWWDGQDVRAGLYRLVDVRDVPDAPHDDLRRRSPRPQRLRYLADHMPCVVTDIANSAPEQAHEVRTGPRRHDRLVVRHAAGAVHLDVPPPQFRDHMQFVPADRHL